MMKMKIRKKTILLAVLNLAAAAAIGIIAGLMYRYRDRPDNDPEGKGRLEDRIAELAESLDARVGVAAVCGDGSAVTYTDSGTDAAVFPMLSVFKFHQALAVCDSLGRAGIPLDEKVTVTRRQLHGNTWSPLRDAHPDGGRFSYRELMEYTLVQSDNNACDILFETVTSPYETERYIHSAGFGDVRIECTEEMMHENLSDCYRNCTSPVSAARLMAWFYSRRDSGPYSAFLWNTMSGCATGQSRIPKYISGKASAIAHKTGTGDVLPDGRIIGVNDLGLVELPDGRYFAIAVFVSDAASTTQECEEFIALAAEAVYEYMAEERIKG